MPLESRNPANGELLRTFEGMGDDELDALVDACVRAQSGWRSTSFPERSECMLRLADALEGRADELAELAVLEMGKTLAEARGEVKKCAWVCRHYAEHGAAYVERKKIASDGTSSYLRYDPLGVVLAIMPWNYPYWQVFRFAAPNLMAGNGALLKHASNVSMCALAIEALIREAGFPEELFRTLLIDAERVAPLIADRRIAGVTLTGSERAGRAVGEAAGRAIKPIVLELGGSDPFIVLADADVERAAEIGTTARCMNSGQSCIAAKRFIVEDAAYDRFVDGLRRRMGSLRMGDPMAESTDLGPLAQVKFRDEIHAQVQRLIAEGGRCILGGEVPAGEGAFYPPTLVVDVPATSETAGEEIFGPVASVFRVDSLRSAIDLANSTEYGLGASVWTADPASVDQATRELAAGAVFVNGMVKSDPRLPFGGIKNSGVGRELGAEGMLAFVNAKTVWIA